MIYNNNNNVMNYTQLYYIIGYYMFIIRFTHYAQLHDVQTLAMLACICQLQCQHVDEYFLNKSLPEPLPSQLLTPYPERKLHTTMVSNMCFV